MFAWETGLLGERLPHPLGIFTRTVPFAVRCPKSRLQGPLHDGTSFFLMKLDQNPATGASVMSSQEKRNTVDIGHANGNEQSW